MPLPPAPTKRAALLSPDVLDAPARSPSRVTRKSENADSAEKPPVLDLFDDRAGGGGDRPMAFKGKGSSRPDEADERSYQKHSSEPIAAPLKTKKARLSGPAKLFVLDTNVLMHDPMCLFRFEEHD
ncbi:MAG: PIN domain-containing protein, partial [Rhodoferax sp.]